MKIHVEVFIASKIIARNKPSFSVDELIGLIQKEFGNSRSGVMTHISAVCVANAPLNHPTGYNYLWRLDCNELRPFMLAQIILTLTEATTYFSQMSKIYLKNFDICFMNELVEKILQTLKKVALAI